MKFLLHKLLQLLVLLRRAHLTDKDFKRWAAVNFKIELIILYTWSVLLYIITVQFSCFRVGT